MRDFVVEKLEEAQKWIESLGSHSFSPQPMPSPANQQHSSLLTIHQATDAVQPERLRRPPKARRGPGSRERTVVAAIATAARTRICERWRHQSLPRRCQRIRDGAEPAGRRVIT